jgi:hypothetical protein
MENSLAGIPLRAGSTNGLWPYNYAEVSAGFLTLVPDRDGEMWVNQETQTDVGFAPWITPYNAAASQDVTILFDWNNALWVLPEAYGYTHTEAGNGFFNEVSVDSEIVKTYVPFLVPNGPTQMQTTSTAYGGNWVAFANEDGVRQIYYNPSGSPPLGWYNRGVGLTTAHSENWIFSDTEFSINPVINADAWATPWFIDADA